MAEQESPDLSAEPEFTEEGEAGQGLAEYALILALIAAVCIGALTLLGQGISQSVAWTIP